MAKKPTTALANYDEELAKYAKTAATLTDTGGGGRFFSMRAGVLQYDDAPLPGNQMCVIISAWCLENVFYEGAYDPDNRTPPACFAFHKDPETKDEMAPDPKHLEDDVFDQQAAACADCPQNEWGSAAKGKGKACSNRRRLACIPAGTYKSAGRGGGFDLELITEEDHYRTAEEAYLKLPVMSGKGFDAYVRDVADQLGRPTFAVYTRVYLTPDPKSQFKVNFELIEPVEDELIPAMIERHRKLIDSIDFPYTPFTAEEETGKTTAASKKLTGKGGPKGGAKKR